MLGYFFLPVGKQQINLMEDVFFQLVTQTGYYILMKNVFTYSYHVTLCVFVCPHMFLSVFFPRSAVEFVAGYSNDPPSVSLLKLRLHVKQCRHPLWPLIFSAAGTGCHIPRIAMFERGLEGGVAAEERWQDCSES